MGNNYYIETEHKKLYPTQVLLLYCPPILLKSIPVLNNLRQYILKQSHGVWRVEPEASL
jgi:hypothetical protein